MEAQANKERTTEGDKATLGPAAIPRVPLTLRVGFSGHRDLKDFNKESLAQAVKDKLEMVRRKAVDFSERHAEVFLREPRLQFLTGLARGADLVVAQTALEAGYTLVPISPFAWRVFLLDFDPTSSDDSERSLSDKQTAQELWDKGYEHQIELNADYQRNSLDPDPLVDDGILDARQEREPLREMHSQGEGGYAALGEFIVDLSDLVFVYIDDGHKPGGRGGTQWVRDLAKQSDIPTIEFKLMGGEVLSDEEAIKQGLSKVLPTLQQYHGEHKKEPFETNLVRDYLSEKDPSRRHVLCRWFAGLYGAFFKRLGGSPVSNGEWDQGPPTQRRADKLATYYNGLYRTSFTLTYLLAFLAVSAAVVGHLLTTASGARPAVGEHGGLGAYFWPTAELLFLAGIGALYSVSRHNHWREKGTDYRLLGELLRVGMALKLLNRCFRLPLPSPQGTDGELGKTWMVWYARFLTWPDVPSAKTYNTDANVAAGKKLISTWLRGQVGYHNRNAQRCRNVERRMRFASNALFGLALLGCLLHLVPLFGHSPLMSWTLILTAAFPALMASLHGICSQGELARQERRSEQMESWLKARIEEIENLTEREGTDTLAKHQRLVRCADSIARTMICEVAEWRWLHSIHDPKLP